MSSFQLTPQQVDAINYPGSMVVIACPGSGKTTVMTEKIIKVTENLPPYKGVIAITFTVKASQELKKRCKRNGHNTKKSYFGTIDGFCLKEIIYPFLSRVWGGNPEECKIIKKLSDEQKVILSKIYSLPTTEDVVSDAGFQQLYNQGVLWIGCVSALAVVVLRESFSARRYIEAKYTHVFIDEYQDSSEAQHQLLKCLLDLGLIAVVVGDVDQTIYEFRGSNPEYLVELCDDNDRFETFRVDVNHRCHPSIVNYASRVLDAEADLLPYNPEDIRVRRVFMRGSLVDAGEKVSAWIRKLVEQSKYKSSEVAVLAKRENSLKLVASGMTVSYRLYVDTPLDQVGTPCSDLFAELLSLKLDSRATVQELLDKYYPIYREDRKGELIKIRSMLRVLRKASSRDEFFDKCKEVALRLGFDSTEDECKALRRVLEEDDYYKLYKPVEDEEIQIMTLHKSKGLEFKVVLHFDMEEWSFPHRVPGVDWDDVNYPSYNQDANLHYVGITRAEDYCILIRTELRQNSSGGFGNSRPSCFLTLPQLQGLYIER